MNNALSEMCKEKNKHQLKRDMLHLIKKGTSVFK